MMKRTTQKPKVKRMLSGGMIGLAGGVVPMAVMDDIKQSMPTPGSLDEEEEKKRKRLEMMSSQSAPKAMKKGGAVRGCGAAVRGKTRGSVR